MIALPRGRVSVVAQEGSDWPWLSKCEKSFVAVDPDVPYDLILEVNAPNDKNIPAPAADEEEKEGGGGGESDIEMEMGEKKSVAGVGEEAHR